MARKLTEAELKDILGPEFFKFLIALIDDSATKTREVFNKTLEKPYNSTVGAMMTRMLVREGFADAGNVQFSEEEHGFVLHSPRNLGIWFEFLGINGRCYKVPKGKNPLKGGAKHREDFFSNVEPDQHGFFSKPWIANVAILWVFDHKGEFVQLRAVIGEGFDDEGKLQTALDFELPTTAAEYESDHFKPTEEEEPLFETPAKKPVEQPRDLPVQE